MNNRALSTAHQNLRTLCLIRLIPLGGLGLASLYFFLSGHMALPWTPIVLLLGLFVLQIAFSWWRSGQPRPIGDGEFFAQLVADVLLFGALLYFTGGASNPFVSYFLVPITIAAITLPRRFTLITGVLCLAAYSALLFWFVEVPDLAPIQAHHHGAPGELNMHIIGMWVNFAASALLIIWFVTRMAEAIRVRDEALVRQQAAATQQRLEDEQLLAVATLAASAAHDLGTPLNTVRLIVDDLRGAAVKGHDHQGDDRDLRIISDQVHRCQETLRKLADTARAYSRQELVATTADRFLTDLVERWLLMRPDVQVAVTRDGDGGGLPVKLHPSLVASIHNILNNAADASPQRVDIHVQLDPACARMIIRDHGPGIDPARLAGNSLGHSEKEDGLGLGLFLSRAILARHGASLAIEALNDGGTRAIIELPLTREAADHHGTGE